MLLNTLRPRRNGRRFADDVFKCIFLNENVWISHTISMKFILNVPINNISALVKILALRRSGDKPLSERIMVSLLTHICVTRLIELKRPRFKLPLLSVNPFYHRHWSQMTALVSIVLNDRALSALGKGAVINDTSGYPFTNMDQL